MGCGHSSEANDAPQQEVPQEDGGLAEVLLVTAAVLVRANVDW